MHGEEIRRRYGGHYIFGLKNQGVSRAFRGKVVINLIFVDDDEAVWDEAARALFMVGYREAICAFTDAAKDSGVELDISTRYGEYRLGGVYGVNKSWLSEFLEAHNVFSVCEYAERCRAECGCAESPLVFVLNRPMRSHAKCASVDSFHKDEFSVVDVTDEPRIIMHELLHQFGAEDYYRPKAAKIAAEHYLPDTIMVKGRTIDSLTRYLIGWCDCIDDAAVSFLDAIKDLPFRPKDKNGFETED
ncbi:MAG: hypothetical protein IKK83_01110 [Clostridia bacterium]|nr:hypothetical protein [Clostridia bacterium]